MVRKVELDPMGNNTFILNHYIIESGKAIIDNKIFDLIHVFLILGWALPQVPVHLVHLMMASVANVTLSQYFPVCRVCVLDCCICSSNIAQYEWLTKQKIKPPARPASPNNAIFYGYWIWKQKNYWQNGENIQRQIHRKYISQLRSPRLYFQCPMNKIYNQPKAMSIYLLDFHALAFLICLFCRRIVIVAGDSKAAVLSDCLPPRLQVNPQSVRTCPIF